MSASQGSEGIIVAVLNRGGAALFHEIAGMGQPGIVLVHGGMCDHRDWDRLAPLLARNRIVVRPDLRGHGRSAQCDADCTVEGWADDLLALVRTIGLDRPLLVGHSLASRIVIEAAAREPDAVGGVVLLDGSRSHSGPAPSPTPAPANLGAIIEQTIGPHADAQARQAIAKRMASASPQTMAACVQAMRDWDGGPADAALAALAGRIPVLAIQSTWHDLANPRRSLAPDVASTPYLDVLRAALPQLETVLFSDAGHFIMLERPDEVARAIDAFCARVANPPADPEGTP